MRKSIPLLALLILGSAFFAPTSSAQNAAKWPLVNCATNTPCTANGPLNTHTGDSLPIAAYKLNTDIKQLALMFGSSSNLALNGSANASDIIGLWTNCTAGTPVLGYQGTCIAGGSGGSATFQANGTNLLSQSTINFINSVATNGLTLTFANPAAGEVQLGLSGILSVAGGGTGTATPGLVAGTNVTITGTWPDQTIAASSTASTAFSAITGSTNTTAAMLVGSGASLGPTGSGTVSANEVNGAGIPASANCVSTNSIGQFTTGCPEPVEAPITAATYTLATTDCGQQLPLENASGVTVTIPGGASFVHCQVDFTVPVGYGTSTLTGSVSPPTNGALTATAGGTLAATTYYVESTWVTAAGETTGAPETSLAVAADDVLNVAAPGSPPPTATGWNVYVSTATGTETKQNTSPIATGTAWVEPTSGLITGTALPASNTAGVTLGGNSTISMAANSQAGINFDGTNWQLIGCTACIVGGGGTVENVQTFTASGTWTKPSGSPQTTWVACLGAGGGGASGAVEASGTASSGGGGGGGGSLNQAIFATAQLAATETVTIGAGGTGGAAQTAAGNGLAGGNGGNSTFGSLLTAYGGVGAAFVGASGTGGNGAGLTGTIVNTSVCAVGGGSAAGNGAGCQGGGAPGGGSVAGVAGHNGGASMLGGAGGGNGGGLATTPASLAGGAGGLAGSLAGPAGGAAAAAGNPGSVLAAIFGGGTGGSGGGSNSAGTGGAGGAGGLGAGGGGGGSSETTSGAGGNGGNGMCVAVTSY